MERLSESSSMGQQGMIDNQAIRSRSSHQTRWYFSAEEISKSPSNLAGMDAGKELWYRYQCADLIQNIGNKLGLMQTAINTGVLYMHRFYQFHSLTRFHRYTMAPVFVFLAAKVEEQPRRLEHVVKTAHRIINSHEQSAANIPPEKLSEDSEIMVTHENVLLQTLAFDILVEHPHAHVIKLCNIIRCDKALSHAAYALATCALHYTKVCIQYQPVLVACMCVHVAAKWSKTQISPLETGQAYFTVMDPTITEQMVQRVADDFLAVIEQYPPKNQERIWRQALGDGMIPGGAAGHGMAPMANKPGTMGSSKMPAPMGVGSGALPPAVAPGPPGSAPSQPSSSSKPPLPSTGNKVQPPPPPAGAPRPPPNAPRSIPAPPSGPPPQAPPPPPAPQLTLPPGAVKREQKVNLAESSKRPNGIAERSEESSNKRSRDGEVLRVHGSAPNFSNGGGRPGSASYGNDATDDTSPNAKRPKKEPDVSAASEQLMRA